MILKVGGGAHVWCKALRNIVVMPSTFLDLQVQLVILVSAFLMVSTVWSVSCLLFFYSRCFLHSQLFVKVGHVPPPMHYVVSATVYKFRLQMKLICTLLIVLAALHSCTAGIC